MKFYKNNGEIHLCCYHLRVRILDFRSNHRGSNPLGSTMVIEVKRTYGYRLNEIYKIEIPDDAIYILEYNEQSFEDAQPHLAIMSSVELELGLLPHDDFRIKGMYIYIFHNLRVLNNIGMCNKPLISDILKEEYLDKWYQKCSKEKGTCAYVKINDIAIDKFVYSHILRDLSIIEFRIRDTKTFSDIISMTIETPMTSAQYYYSPLLDEHRIDDIRRKLEGKLKYLL